MKRERRASGYEFALQRYDHTHRHYWDRADDGRSATHVAARFSLDLEHIVGTDDFARCDEYERCARIFHLSCAFACHDAVPTCPERVDDKNDSK